MSSRSRRQRLAAGAVLATTSILGTYLVAIRPQPTYASPNGGAEQGADTGLLANRSLFQPRSAVTCDVTNTVTNQSDLDDAINDANFDPSTADVICIDGAITLTSPGLTQITSTLTIAGNGGGDDTITVAPSDAAVVGSLLDAVLYDDTLSIQDLAFQGGVATEGGAIRLGGRGSLVVSDSTFGGSTGAEGNTAQRGGAVFVLGSDLTVSNSVFANNTAYGEIDAYGFGGGGYGGAIYASEGSATITDSTFSSNTATSPDGTNPDGYYFHGGYGGAIFRSRGDLSVLRSTFSSNTATGTSYDYGGPGGAIYIDHGDLSVSEATFGGSAAEGNTARYGAAIYSGNAGYLAHLSVSNSTFSYNTSSEKSSIFVRESELTAAYSSFSHNEATNGRGGAIYSFGVVRAVNSYFGSNSAGQDAGAIFVNNNNAFIYFSTFYDNVSTTPGEVESVKVQDFSTIDYTLTVRGSVIGSSTATDAPHVYARDLDDEFFVVTGTWPTGTPGIGSQRVAPGSLSLGAVSGAGPGAPGRSPGGSSVLAVCAPGGDLATSVTKDQLDVARSGDFTIGARQVAAASSSTLIMTAAAPPGSATEGTAYSGYTFTASGTPAPTWSIDSGALPAGLTLNSVSGVLSGTPTAAGSYSFVVKASNGSCTATSSSISLTVSPPAATAPVITAASPPGSGMVGTGYAGYTFTASGSAPIAWSVDSGALPAGLTLNSTTGVLSGTPTTAGSYSFVVKATNSAGSDTSSSITITIDEVPSLVDDTPPGSGTVGSAYAGYTFTASGTPAPTWSIDSGALPAGLTLNSASGVLSGTPTTAGSYSFVVKATNSAGSDTSSSITITIDEVPVITAASPPGSGTVGSAYAGYTFTASGTPAPTWSIDSGALPAGLTLNSASGVLSGTPTTAGSYSFVVRATNSAGSAVSSSLMIAIDEVPVITAASPPGSGTVGSAYAGYTFTASGAPAPSWSIDSGALPAGLSLNSVSGVLSGTPTTAGSYSFVVRATNSAGSVTSSSITIAIAAAPTPTPTPAPPPSPASSPRMVSVEPGDRQVDVSWQAPLSSGTFPVTSYQAVATSDGGPGLSGASCLVTAPALTCTITGLTDGQIYTVQVRGLSGAGWGAFSDPSEPFTPRAPVVKSIVITGMRERIEDRQRVIVEGETSGLVGAEVTPWMRFPGSSGYQPGRRVVTVAADGTFTWQRHTRKRISVYFAAENGEVRSNRVIIRR